MWDHVCQLLNADCICEQWKVYRLGCGSYMGKHVIVSVTESSALEGHEYVCHLFRAEPTCSSNTLTRRAGVHLYKVWNHVCNQVTKFPALIWQKPQMAANAHHRFLKLQQARLYHSLWHIVPAIHSYEL
jgi:hypothetical protein